MQDFETAYRKFTPDIINNTAFMEEYLAQNSESLIAFLEDVWRVTGHWDPDSSVAELGCGLGGLSSYLAAKFKRFKAFDNSKLAISLARGLHPMVNFNIADPCAKSPGQYDYIIDSHLLHCLDIDSRAQYFSQLRSSLSSQGKLCIETMCIGDRLEVPVDYELTETGELFYRQTPIRVLRSFKELEAEFKSHGFLISYFYYHSELSFALFEDMPHDLLPKTARVVLHTK